MNLRFRGPSPEYVRYKRLEKERGLWARWTTLATSYESLLNEFHQSRAFFLEVMVVIILLIDIGFLFIGKRLELAIYFHLTLFPDRMYK